VSAIAQPTTRRENRSKITARYNQPSDVSTAVQSVTHLVLGASAVKSRLRILGAKRADASLLVLIGRALRLGCADSPRACIKRTTRLRPQCMPRVLSTAWIRGLP